MGKQKRAWEKKYAKGKGKSGSKKKRFAQIETGRRDPKKKRSKYSAFSQNYHNVLRKLETKREEKRINLEPSKVKEQTPKKDKMKALTRLSGELPDEDLEELIEYAKYKRARKRLTKNNK